MRRSQQARRRFPRSRSLRSGLVLALSVSFIAGCSADISGGTPTTTEDASNEAEHNCVVADASQLVPETGALFGVNLDWDDKTLAEYSADVGVRPAVTVSFVTFPLSDTDAVNLDAAAGQVAANGGALLITLEPFAGLDTVTDATATEFATRLSQYNNSGVPVIVRFAHEMNGSWYSWGQQPAEYIRAFRTVAMAIQASAPGSSMMWAPNNASGYPFTGGSSQAQPGTSDFATLDTNGDGELTIDDDAYAPFYPGDDVVDWVGMSLYHWGSVHPWGENELPEDGKFAAQLTGTYVGLGGDESAAPDFYQIYGVDHNKPIAIPETAALVVDGADISTELAIKQAWWRQVFSEDLPTRFPQVKMINWFEWDKLEPEVGAEVDWTVTSHPEIQSAFRSDRPSWLVYASDDECG